MNYLGHAFLSFGDAEILTGNMIGDHVKGTHTPDQFPEKIKEGIVLHRAIDTFTDAHPALQRAKIWFRPDYGLYAGAIMDTLMDHYIANDARYFSSAKALKDFTLDTYQKLEQHRSYFPVGFEAYFPHMVEHNWLYNYRSINMMQRPLQGLARRAKHMPPPEKAFETFVTNYYHLEQCYYEFIDDVVKFVKTKLTQQ